MDNEDEVVFNTLLAEGCDVPTAYVAATAPKRRKARVSLLGVAFAIAAVILWLLI